MKTPAGIRKRKISNEELVERILRLAGFIPDIYVIVRPSPYPLE